jgi:hypothetical protein
MLVFDAICWQSINISVALVGDIIVQGKGNKLCFINGASFEKKSIDRRQSIREREFIEEDHFRYI